jgi:hypothetical protein
VDIPTRTDLTAASARDQIAVTARDNGWTLDDGDDPNRLVYRRANQSVEIVFGPDGQLRYATGARRGISPRRVLRVALAMLGAPRPLS